MLDQLRGNYIPSLSEKIAIADMISQVQAQYSLYDAEFIRQEVVTEKLQSERRRIEWILQSLRSFSSPIRRIPPEVLVLIFEACCELGDHLSNNLANTVGLAPLNIGLVCRYWRDVTMSTPSLWSTLSVVMKDVTEHTAAVTRLFLKNSGEHPLTFQVFDDVHAAVYTLEHSHVTQELALEGHRCRHLRQLGYQGTFNTILRGEEMLLLEQLRLDDDNVDIDTIAQTPGSSPSFQDAPNLRSVELVNSLMLCRLEGVGLQLPLSQITSAIIDETDVSLVIEVLNQFPNIIHASISLPLAMTHADGFIVIPLCAAQQLSSLTLDLGLKSDAANSVDMENMDMQLSMVQFFESITLPALTSVTIICSPQDPIFWAHHYFVDMLSRSGCALKQLTMRNILTSGACLLALFEFTPTLVDLTFEEREGNIRNCIVEPFAITNKVIEGLILSSNSKPLLPKLRRLDLTLQSLYVSTELVSDMVGSRCTPALECPSSIVEYAGYLEEVYLRFKGDVDTEIMRSLRGMGRDGFTIRVGEL